MFLGHFDSPFNFSKSFFRASADVKSGDRESPTRKLSRTEQIEEDRAEDISSHDTSSDSVTDSSMSSTSDETEEEDEDEDEDDDEEDYARKKDDDDDYHPPDDDNRGAGSGHKRKLDSTKNQSHAKRSRGPNQEKDRRESSARKFLFKESKRAEKTGSLATEDSFESLEEDLVTGDLFDWFAFNPKVNSWIQQNREDLRKKEINHGYVSEINSDNLFGRFEIPNWAFLIFFKNLI